MFSFRASSVTARYRGKYAGPKTIGIILPGMGRGGAGGLKAMKDAGAWTTAQDEASCVVYGMPKAGVDAKGVSQVLPLDLIAEAAIHRLGLQ